MTRTGTERPRAVPKDASRHVKTAEDASLYYLYCVVEKTSPACSLLEQRAIPGIQPDEPLFAIEAAGLVAAASRVPKETFEEQSLNALLREITTVAPFAVRHEQAVRALMPAAAALVPLSLGTICHTAESACDLLSREAERFHRLLDRVRNKQEWEVKIVGDAALLQDAALEHSEQVRRIETEMASSSPGRAYLLRKQRELLLAGEVERFLKESVDTVLSRLMALGLEARTEEIPPAPAGPVFLVSKTAFLVDPVTLPVFEALVTELGRVFGPLGLRAELTGPWAPYSFVRERDV